MSPIKRFLLIYVALYSALAVLGLVLFRSPDLSSAYLARHKADHERYVRITNNPQFRIFRERPHLYPPDDPRQAQLQFVRGYVEQPEYKAERIRIEAFSLYFHLLNGGMFLVFVMRLGYRPTLAYLDRRVAEIRARLGSAANARTAAMHRLAEAEAEAGEWPRREEDLKARADEAIDANVVQIREEARLARIQLARETEDRKRAEVFRAAALIKEEMVSQAVASLEKRYSTEATELELRQNVAQFVRLLELIT